MIDPEPPRTEDDEVAPPDPPLSRLAVPVSIPLQTLVDLLEDAVPSRFGSLTDFREIEGRDRVSLAYELEREPFAASVVDDQARLETTIRYRVRVSYDLPALPDLGGSCGTSDDEPPSLYVAIVSPLSLDREWVLRTRARVAEVRPSSDDETDLCAVTMLGIDITDDLVAGARAELEAHLSEIDALAASVDTRTRFASWWGTLQTPIRLDEGLWLSMQPEEVRRGSIRGAGDSITVALSLGARPRIVFGDEPALDTVPLPPLDSGAVAPHLDLLVDARADYASASRFMREHLGGEEIRVQGRVVRLDSLRVYGIGSGRLAMEIHVSGDVRGRLFLTGRPAIDSETGHISVPDLVLDVATRNVVTSTVSWLASRGFRDVLRERATWPSDPAVRWLEGWLHEGLNRRLSRDVRVSGTVDSLRIVGAMAMRDALLVRVSARGSASLFVE